eukprot:UN1167
MWIDFLIISLGTVDTMERFSGSDHMGANPMVFRFARIARMFHMLKVLKMKDGFSSLFLLFKSIYASTQALFWSVLLLLAMMTCIGILMNQLIYGYLADSAFSAHDRREVYEYFGTYTRMLTTMLELTLGNWAPPSRVLMSKVSQWWGLFIVFYRLVLCFCLVNVANAVFITETNRVAAADDEVIMMRKERSKRAATERLEDLFHELDDSGDGIVTWDEFQISLGDPVMRQFLATLDLEVGDLEELFRLLDNGTGRVVCSDFVRGINTIRGQAKNIDLLTLVNLTKQMNTTLVRLKDDLFPKR